MKPRSEMTIDQNGLKQIEKIVNGAIGKMEKNLRKEIAETAEKTTVSLRKEIAETAENTKKALQQDIQNSENKIVAVLSREITDLAEINRAVIQRVDKISELEKRIVRLETLVIK